MKFILGKKLNMTRIWEGDKVIPVTRVAAGPCRVAFIKKNERDGYSAIQLGFGEKKAKKIKKPQAKQPGELGNFRYLREFRIEGPEAKRGDIIAVDIFAPGDIVKVTGLSKGKGYQGVVKRHGFAGASKTHGTKDQLRMPGSSGATGPQHVFKGMKKPGRMGNERVTTANLEIIKVDSDNNILMIKGAVPGARDGLLMISGPGELKVKIADETAKQPVAEDKEAKKDEKPAVVQDQKGGVSAKPEAGEAAAAADKAAVASEGKK